MIGYVFIFFVLLVFGIYFSYVKYRQCVSGNRLYSAVCAVYYAYRRSDSDHEGYRRGKETENGSASFNFPLKN